MARIDHFKGPFFVDTDEISRGGDHQLVGRIDTDVFAVDSEEDRPLHGRQLPTQFIHGHEPPRRGNALSQRFETPAKLENNCTSGLNPRKRWVARPEALRRAW